MQRCHHCRMLQQHALLVLLLQRLPARRRRCGVGLLAGWRLSLAPTLLRLLVWLQAPRAQQLV